MFGLCPDCGVVHDLCRDCKPFDTFTSDMRRYLFRNVAAEYRKGLDNFHKMPQVPGWS